MKAKVTQVHGTEVDVLKVVKELGTVNPIMVAHRMKFGGAYADYLCRYLAKYGFLEKSGRTYSITAKGKQALKVDNRTLEQAM